MKKASTAQLLNKKYVMLTIPAEWKPTLGSLPRNFIGIIYGASGNGKTELVLRVAKVLANEEAVDWISYEQQHGYDLQVAVERNKMHEAKNQIRWIDPIPQKKTNTTKFQDIVAHIKKTRSRVIIIDSVDYLQLTVDQYYELKAMFGHRKIIIFISHAVGKQPATNTAQKIQYDGLFGILVKNYMAWPVKSRVGGFEPYIIWEEKARQLNALYFAKQEQEAHPPANRKRTRKTKTKQ